MTNCRCECGWPIFNGGSRRVSLACPQCGELIDCPGTGIHSETTSPTAAQSSQLGPHHWDPLHRYAVEHRYNWSPESAATFYREWFAELPGAGCGSCLSNWKSYTAADPPDFSSARAFFVWGWSAHNDVSANHANKPTLPLVDAMLLHGWQDTTYIAETEPVQLLQPTILHPLPEVRNDRALCVIAVDERSQAELALTRPLTQQYAESHSLDYVEITAVTGQRHPTGNKYAAAQVAADMLS